MCYGTQHPLVTIITLLIYSPHKRHQQVSHERHKQFPPKIRVSLIHGQSGAFFLLLFLFFFFFVHISLNTHKRLEGTPAVILVSDFLSYISLSLLLRSNKSCTETLLPGTQARKTNDAVIQPMRQPLSKTLQTSYSMPLSLSQQTPAAPCTRSLAALIRQKRMVVQSSPWRQF